MKEKLHLFSGLLLCISYMIVSQIGLGLCFKVAWIFTFFSVALVFNSFSFNLNLVNNSERL